MRELEREFAKETTCELIKKNEEKLNAEEILEMIESTVEYLWNTEDECEIMQKC